jgi:aminoglycoside phosphotransferase (APT) family kinase protein
VGASPKPEAEVVVDVALAEALVAAQHPDLAAPLRPVAEGWDNAVFRLGDHLAVRLPRRLLGAQLVAGEFEWLPRLAPLVPVEVPSPVRRGEPDEALGYPFPWAVVRWVHGEPALGREAGLGGDGVVDVLTSFLSALRGIDPPPDAPRNPWRGVPLAARSEALEGRLDQLPVDVDRGAVRTAWEQALAVGTAPGPPRWVHGDLHPGNLVVRGGRLVGVIDWGDLNASDAACDLGVAWMLLDGAGRSALRDRLGVDDPSWERARGNALAHAVAVLAHSADAPAMAAMGRRTLDAVLGDL